MAAGRSGAHAAPFRSGTHPGWHQQASVLELLINKDTWNGMSEGQQMVVDVLCRAATADSFAYTEAIQFESMKKNVDKRGVTNKKLMPSCRAHSGRH